MEEEKKNSEKEVEKKDNRSLGEKIEDGYDEVIGTMEDIVYGENPDFQSDIPATMPKGDNGRRVNKIQTRKNINKKVFGKWGYKALAIIIGVGLIVCLGYFIIEKLLLA